MAGLLEVRACHTYTGKIKQEIMQYPLFYVQSWLAVIAYTAFPTQACSAGRPRGVFIQYVHLGAARYKIRNVNNRMHKGYANH